MNKIIEALNSDKKVLVITGAGISTLSGIPDFRGKGGLYCLIIHALQSFLQVAPLLHLEHLFGAS